MWAEELFPFLNYRLSMLRDKKLKKISTQASSNLVELKKRPEISWIFFKGKKENLLRGPRAPEEELEKALSSE